jgi:hypothetical protein
MNLPLNKRVRPIELRALRKWPNRVITRYRLAVVRVVQLLVIVQIPATIASSSSTPAGAVGATMGAVGMFVFVTLGLLRLLSTRLTLGDVVKGGGDGGVDSKPAESDESPVESPPVEPQGSQDVPASGRQ